MLLIIFKKPILFLFVLFIHIAFFYFLFLNTEFLDKGLFFLKENNLDFDAKIDSTALAELKNNATQKIDSVEKDDQPFKPLRSAIIDRPLIASTVDAERIKQHVKKVQEQKELEIRKRKDLEEQIVRTSKIIEEQKKQQAEIEEQRIVAEKLAKEEEQKLKNLQEKQKVVVEETEDLKKQAELAEAEKKKTEELNKKLLAELKTKKAHSKKIEKDNQIIKLKKKESVAKLRTAYISSIAAKIKKNWRTPARIHPQAQCNLRITQNVNGEVTSLQVLNCNKHVTEQFKFAAEAAVYRSEPLPKSPVSEVFDKVVEIVFKP